MPANKETIGRKQKKNKSKSVNVEEKKKQTCMQKKQMGDSKQTCNHANVSNRKMS